MVNPISPGSAILAVLRHGPAHGTEICKRAAKLTGNHVKLGQASLYTALSRLEQKRFVSRTVVKRERGGRPAHVYELTAKGREFAKAQLSLIQALYGKGGGKKAAAKVDKKPARRKRFVAVTNGHKPKAKAKARKKSVKKAAPKLQPPKPASAKVPADVPAMLGGAPS